MKSLEEAHRSDSMRKHLLIAIRDSKLCPQGIRFVGNFFQKPKKIEISLLYLTAGSASQASGTMWEDGEDTNLESVSARENQCFAIAKRNLLRKGYVESDIKTKIRATVKGTGRDILSEGSSGYYDAVVLGSRASSFLEGLVMGDVGRQILEHGVTFPIWFCRDIEEDRRDILLCLDGSKTSDKVADHVGYMLEGEAKHSITLLYIDKGQGLDTKEIFARATDILIEHNFPLEKITSKIISSSRVVHSILRTVEKEKYAVVALGWAGRTPQTGIRKWLAGEKCREVLHNIKKVALWIVP